RAPVQNAARAGAWWPFVVAERIGVIDPIQYQHNFLIIAPAGYVSNRRIQFSDAGNQNFDTVILLFDPWRDLLPRTYRPVPWSAALLTPTRILEFVESMDYRFYRDNV